VTNTYAAGDLKADLVIASLEELNLTDFRRLSE
jgi:hypothetical protein